MCEAHAAQAALATAEPADVAGGREYTVQGMTCDHCALSVTEEVAQVPGVTAIDVDVTAGRVLVRGAGFTDDAIRDAVDEAGYDLVA